MSKEAKGLSQQEAENRLRRYGLNTLVRPEPVSIVKLISRQLFSPLMVVLIVALGVTLVLGDRLDAGVILLAVCLNALLGFWQEYKAERSLEALTRVLITEVRVRRAGEVKTMAADKLVPGDLVLLAAGDRVMADGIVLEADEMIVNEAVLTGESLGVRKTKSQEINIFAGTTILQGEGLMEVKLTGMKTQMGTIAGHLAKTPEAKTPLQQKLDQFSHRLSWLTVVVAISLFGIGVALGHSMMSMLLVSVAIAVAAIPESMAISLTAVLAIGMQRILRRKALVRKLLAAEVLGSVSVICTDKTGTLTEGVMKVEKVLSTEETFLLKAGILTNGGRDQLEAAYWEFASEKLGEVMVEEVKREEPILKRIPFKSEVKYSLTMTQKYNYLVGAPEVILTRSSLSEEERKTWSNKLLNEARSGNRVIGVAVKHQREDGINRTRLGRNWHFLGLVVMSDPVRSGLVKVLKEVGSAGIGVKIITGDFLETAQSVAAQLKMGVKLTDCLDGAELDVMDFEELKRRVGKLKIFSRINPSQKLMIVEALQAGGEVVAMTGDGVNDAPALKKADIGIVVSNATDVAKETADMVLLDNNFATIVAAIEEGRGMYKNLKKIILYLLADSMTQVVLMAGAILLGWEIPLLTAQVLWVNLVSDSLPALALTVDPHVLDLMHRPPYKRNEPLIDKTMLTLIGVISLVSGLIALGVFGWGRMWGLPIEVLRTLTFTVVVGCTLILVYASRSMNTPLWKDPFWRNGWLNLAVIFGLGVQVLAVYSAGLQALLSTVALPVSYWLVVAGAALVVIMAIELTKHIYASMKR